MKCELQYYRLPITNYQLARSGGADRPHRAAAAALGCGRVCCRRPFPSHHTAAGGHTERRYTPIELFELLVLADLRRRGFSVHQLHAILDALKDQFGTRLFDATGGGGPVQLLTDGREIYARSNRGEIYNLLKAPDAAAAGDRRRGLLRELGGRVRAKTGKKRVSGSEKSSRGRRPAAE